MTRAKFNGYGSANKKTDSRLDKRWKTTRAFLEWKKKVSVLRKGFKMTKADPEFTCLCIYQWPEERGHNILDNVSFAEDDLKKWEKHL